MALKVLMSWENAFTLLFDSNTISEWVYWDNEGAEQIVATIYIRLVTNDKY
jgi:hypothetical protein